MKTEVKPTKEQLRILNLTYKGGLHTCPSCKVSYFAFKDIENKGENKTQIYCNYGCGYIFLEDYINL
jgi:hypothetical protein